MMSLRRIWVEAIGSACQCAAVLLVAAMLVSCANSGQPKKVIALSFVGAADLNPDINGRPSPVAISIFQLANTSAFRKSDYMSLAENGKAALGRELVAVNTLTIRPGQALDVELPVAKGEAAFGIVVGYRVIDASGWQLIYEYPRAGSLWSRFGGKEVSSHRILVEKNRVQFEPVASEH